MQIAYERTRSSFGEGLFARQRVEQGALVWKYTPITSGVLRGGGEGEGGDEGLLEGNVIEYEEQAAIAHINSLASLSLNHAQQFLDLTYGRGDKLCQIIDDGRFMNHSLTPNCLTNMQTGHTYALRVIEDGEELYEDYTNFDHPSFLFPLLAKYKCEPTYYPLPPHASDAVAASSSSSSSSTPPSSVAEASTKAAVANAAAAIAPSNGNFGQEEEQVGTHRTDGTAGAASREAKEA